MTRFECNEQKNLSNKRKHGVTFQQAADVFLDPYHVSKLDRMVDGEQRWQTTGRRRDTLLLVAHTVEEENTTEEVIRIISARVATPQERQSYETENRKLYI